MSTEDVKQRYVEKCERSRDRLAITFQFPNELSQLTSDAISTKFTWWQRSADFLDAGFDDWEEEAAADYASCAERLAGYHTFAGFPNIAMGDLRISISPRGIAQVSVSYYDYGGAYPMGILEAEYVFTMPAVQLSAAFKEAAAAIRRSAPPAVEKPATPAVEKPAAPAV